MWSSYQKTDEIKFIVKGRKQKPKKIAQDHGIFRRSKPAGLSYQKTVS
jgi:hypothetical protein